MKYYPSRTRPCYVDGKKALFHKWSDRAEAIAESPMIGGHPAGIIKWTVGIVEFEDGTVKEKAPSEIRFADGGDFSRIAWNEYDVTK